MSVWAGPAFGSTPEKSGRCLISIILLIFEQIFLQFGPPQGKSWLEAKPTGTAEALQPQSAAAESFQVVTVVRTQKTRSRLVLADYPEERRDYLELEPYYAAPYSAKH